MAGDEIQPSLMIYSGMEEQMSGMIFGMVFVVFFFVIIQNLLVLIFTNGFEKAMEYQEKEIEKHEAIKKNEKEDEESLKMSIKKKHTMAESNLMRRNT